MPDITNIYFLNLPAVKLRILL